MINKFKVKRFFKVRVEWSDNHISHFESTWLQSRSFKKDQFEHRNSMASGPKKELWVSEHQNNIKHHNFENIVSDERSLYSWLKGMKNSENSVVRKPT